jgi:hypothetical protein
MSPFSKDETGHASPAGTILPFTLHVTGLIPHGDIHTLFEYSDQREAKNTVMKVTFWKVLPYFSCVDAGPYIHLTHV